jgi:predicted dinucleotide-binding enzyme
MRSLKIGILGTGDVGQALGRGFVSLGHEVRMGSREAGNEKARAWVSKNGERASAGTFADAAAFGEIVFLATIWVHPDFPGGPPDMFICGNDAGAKRAVTGICEAFGWPVIDIGGIEGSRLLEPLCILWVLYGIQHNSWNHAFKLLRK